MARGNTVIMMGVLLDKPIIKVNKDGDIVSGRFIIQTTRRTSMNSQNRLVGEARMDEQLIMSRNEIVIEHGMSDLEIGDIIMIRGTLSTREIPKKVRCPYCGEVAVQNMGVMVYVDPELIMKVRKAGELSKEETDKFLLTFSGLSNYSFFFGTLVREPRYAPNYGGTTRKETNIQIAVNRKREIIEDGPDKRTDYPYVRTFGKMAEETAKVLHTGSEIYTESSIQTRNIEIKKICPNCSSNFIIESSAVEIVPYSIEYISNVDTDILRENDEDEEDEVE